MKVRDIDKIKSLLKARLSEYLIENGCIVERTKVSCPNVKEHKHGDKEKLSAAFLPQTNNTQIYCFVENKVFDIFDVYSMITGKSLIGNGFFEAVQELATKFKIPFDVETEYSPKETEKWKKQQLLEEFHKISLQHIKDGIEFYKKRKLSSDKVKLWRIGFITPELIPDILNKKFKILFEYGLTSVINYPALVIPLYNENHQYAGLVLRQFNCPDSDRYLNISLEGKNLFNINNVKSKDNLYITEGVFDAIAFYPETNVVAVLTNTLHDKDVESLNKHSFKSITLALDADNLYTGLNRDGVLKSIMKLKNTEADISVLKLPEDLKDPDELFCAKGELAFKTLPKITALEYLLENFKKGILPLDKIYEFIAGCPDIIRKEQLINQVVKTLEIGKKQLLKEIEKTQENKLIINLLDYVREKEHFEELLNEFSELAWTKQFKGMPSGYTAFDKYIGGFEDTLYLLVGFPESGKTTFLLNFVLNLVQNPKNYVAFYSLDDGAKRAILPRLLSMLTNMTSKNIKEPTEKDKELWTKGMNTLYNWKSNFTLKDGADIRTVWDLEQLLNIHYNIATEQGKKFIIVIDNLHALVSSSKFESVENIQRVAGFLKRIPQKFNCPIIATAEVPKSSKNRPTGKDIKESIDLWYAARFVGGLAADFYNSSESNLIWNNDGTFMPIIEMYVSKNQTGTSWHGSLHYKMNFHNSQLIECTEEETKLLSAGQYLY